MSHENDVTNFLKYLDALQIFYEFQDGISLFHTLLKNRMKRQLESCGFEALRHQLRDGLQRQISLQRLFPLHIITLLTLLHTNAEYLLISLEAGYLEKHLPATALNFQSLLILLSTSQAYQHLAENIVEVWDDKHLTMVLRHCFGISSFHANQLQAIRATLHHQHVTALFPTGFGKSLLYMLPSAMEFGVTLVFMPLCSLILDQQRRLDNIGISSVWLKAALNEREENVMLSNLARRFPSYSVVFLTPEKFLRSRRIQDFMMYLHQRGLLRRIVLDECHCISLWGHSFRPSYVDLCRLLKVYAGTPLLCLTATADGAIIHDIHNLLNIVGSLVFRESFNRPNLSFIIMKKKKTIWDDIVELIRSFNGETGIVYCRTQKECENLAKYLSSKYIKSSAYHADLKESLKEEVVVAWRGGIISVVVATIAFGLGNL